MVWGVENLLELESSKEYTFLTSIFLHLKMLYTGSPYLCELEEFNKILKKVWSKGILTNDGPFLHEFERELCKLLTINQYIFMHLFYRRLEQ